MSDQQQIQIKAKDEDLKGTYSNLMQILHTKEEFILDFFLVSPPSGVLASRVIMNPSHVKRLLTALKDNVEKYESQHGKIEEAKSPEIREDGIGFKMEKQ